MCLKISKAKMIYIANEELDDPISKGAAVEDLQYALKQALEYVPDDPIPMPKDGFYPGRDKNNEFGIVWIDEGKAEWTSGDVPISDISQVVLGDRIEFPII